MSIRVRLTLSPLQLLLLLLMLWRHGRLRRLILSVLIVLLLLLHLLLLRARGAVRLRRQHLISIFFKSFVAVEHRVLLRLELVEDLPHTFFGVRGVVNLSSEKKLPHA